MFLVQNDIIMGMLNYLKKRTYEEVCDAIKILESLQPLSESNLEEIKKILDKKNIEKVEKKIKPGVNNG